MLQSNIILSMVTSPMGPHSTSLGGSTIGTTSISRFATISLKHATTSRQQRLLKSMNHTRPAISSDRSLPSLVGTCKLTCMADCSTSASMKTADGKEKASVPDLDLATFCPSAATDIGDWSLVCRQDISAVNTTHTSLNVLLTPQSRITSTITNGTAKQTSSRDVNIDIIGLDLHASV